MINKICAMFSSAKGQKVILAAKKIIAELNIDLGKGVLVGFSGGPDSVMLLSLLCEMSNSVRPFKIIAVHINHCIRGDEALRDENFARDFSNMLGIEFESFEIDVPKIAHERSLSLEEAARIERYSKFSEILSGRKDVGYIAVGHNSTDNLETVIFNMMRGAGTRGMSGIRPCRDNIFRPLLGVSKNDIKELLDRFAIPYVVDGTNGSVEYTRNFIRHEIVPKLSHLAHEPENMVGKMCGRLRKDDEYITEVAKKIVRSRTKIGREELVALHSAVLSRVLRIMASDAGTEVFSTHIDKIGSLLETDNFSYSVNRGVFVCERGVCGFTREMKRATDYRYDIRVGVTDIPQHSARVFLADEAFEKSSLNVYKFSIQANLASAIIVGELYIRPKKDGDTIFYGGHTRKLKKMFCDAKIPPSIRFDIPILCDDRGVVWVPGFGVRDDGGNTHLNIAIASYDSENRFRFGNEFR